MLTSGSVVGAPVLLLSFLASIDLFSSSLINAASVACAGLRPAYRHPAKPAGSVYTQRHHDERGSVYAVGLRLRLHKPQWPGVHDSPCLVDGDQVVGRDPFKALTDAAGPTHLHIG